MKEDLEVISKESKTVQKSGDSSKSSQRLEDALMAKERVSFVITKRRSHSWADDLHSCECRKELDKVYH